jgi:hypothetical protein
MNNKHIKNTAYDKSLLGYAAATFVSMAEDAVQNSYPQIRQDVTETEANGQVKPVKRERVYLHSIGRFSKLRKLQMGTYGD